MPRASLAILLLCAAGSGFRADAQTVITMPPPARHATSASPVMMLVAQAMEHAARDEAGMTALYRYAHAKRAPYNVYHVQPRGGSGANLNWDYDANYWYFYPRRLWGSYWGWWGWPGCVTWGVNAPPASSPCRATVLTIL